jgi:hypothetical protein
MVIDNRTLLKYGGTPSDPSSRPAWIAAAVFLVGASCLGAMTVLAWGDVSRSRVACVIIIAAVAVVLAFRLVGWFRSGGGIHDFLEACTWIRSPWESELGSIAAGEEERDGLERAWGALFWLSVLAVGLMRLKCPGIVP